LRYKKQQHENPIFQRYFFFHDDERMFQMLVYRVENVPLQKKSGTTEIGKQAKEEDRT